MIDKRDAANVSALAGQNIADALDRGPGLRYSTGIFVIVKDTKNERVLVGGLGGMGVGQMWRELGDSDKAKEGYDAAPDIDTSTHDAWLNYFTGKLDIWNRQHQQYLITFLWTGY